MNKTVVHSRNRDVISLAEDVAGLNTDCVKEEHSGVVAMGGGVGRALMVQELLIHHVPILLRRNLFRPWCMR